MLIIEKDGRILMFPNTQTVATTTVFLDIRDRVYSNSDSGMTYFAFHPDFGKAGSPNRGYVYITYKYSPNGDNGDQSYWRLSRFTVPDGQTVADPNSEVILIQQFDQQQWHDSGCLLFGPDGFLYVGVGDEGGENDQYNDSQKITDRLYSGILRIDVNQDATKSHPIRRQPQQFPSQPAGWPSSFTANYYIPNDNPFVNPNGSVLEEFYAIGFRNPYRFNYDSATGEIWVGDVGQDTREEVDKLIKGANYGWAFREGIGPGPKASTPPNPVIGTLTDPLWDYAHNDPNGGGCVVGGYFYYGTAQPYLHGKFIVVDNVTGRIWALSRNGANAATAEYLTSMPSGSVYSGTVSCIQDQSGELYFMKLGDNYAAEIYQLARTGATIPDPPAKLSDVGAFSDLATLTPAPGLIPYNVNTPLWSDGAVKHRWIAIPNDGTPDSAAEQIKFAPESEWQFPPGTVFVKEFDLPVDDAHPETLRRLETRFIVMSSTGEPYGVTYRWRPDGTDADLLTDGQDEAITIATTDGGTRQQTWTYPSRSNCMVCHNANAKYVLGVKTHQLNGDFTYAETGRTANQLATLAHLGFFDSGYQPQYLPYFLQSKAISDGIAPLETRVRSYIDSNCSQCHRPGGVRANFDARFVTPLGSQNLIWGKIDGSFTGEPESVLQPGDTVHSIMYRRDDLLGAQQMPPISKNVIDTQWISVLQAYIATLSSGPAVTLSIDHFGTGGEVFVRVVFTNSVTGLTSDDFLVRGGSIVSLTGSGASYTLEISPTSKGTVHVELPAGAAFAAGLPNYDSNKLAVDPQDPNLVLWYKLDETSGLVASDSSTGDHDGAASGILNSDWSAGKFNNALTFDQTNAKITMSNVIGADFTVSFWMKTTQAFPVTNVPFSGVPLFWSDTGGNAADFCIVGTSSGTVNRITFDTGPANAAAIVLQGTKPVNTGNWVHVAIRRVQSSGSMQIYINGVLDTQTTGSTDNLISNAFIETGASSGTPNPYRGAIDQIRMYNRALSATEIAALAAETPSAGSPLDIWFAAHLPGLYHLQELYLDPDGDGINNAGEFAFNTNPLQIDPFTLGLGLGSGATMHLTGTVRTDAPGLLYNIQFSPDLKTWTPAGNRITSFQDAATSDPSYSMRTWNFTPAPGDSTDHMFFRVQTTGISLQ